MNILKKNQIIIYTLAFMLVTAGYLNYTNNIKKETNETSALPPEDSVQNVSIEEENIADIGDATLVSSNDVVTDYFVKSKLERDSMYSQMIESYEKIINSSNSSEVQKQSATQEITKINNIKNSIMICENLIKTKGFENCVVFVNDESVSVIVSMESLKSEQVAQIQNIISRELKVDIEKIHISIK